MCASVTYTVQTLVAIEAFEFYDANIYPRSQSTRLTGVEKLRGAIDL
jgi:hypothetical protein